MKVNGTFTAIEWKVLSERGEVCGVLGCQPDGPMAKCQYCGNHYCAEHAEVHAKVVWHVKPLVSGES